MKVRPSMPVVPYSKDRLDGNRQRPGTFQVALNWVLRPGNLAEILCHFVRTLDFVKPVGNQPKPLIREKVNVGVCFWIRGLLVRVWGLKGNHKDIQNPFRLTSCVPGL